MSKQIDKIANKRLDLYNSLSQQYDMPEYKNFLQELQDPVRRDTIFERASQIYDIPDKSVFDYDLGFANYRDLTKKILSSVPVELDNITAKFKSIEAPSDALYTDKKIIDNIPGMKDLLSKSYEFSGMQQEVKDTNDAPMGHSISKGMLEGIINFGALITGGYDPENLHVSQEEASLLRDMGLINAEQFKKYQEVESLASWTKDITSGLTTTALIGLTIPATGGRSLFAGTKFASWLAKGSRGAEIIESGLASFKLMGTGANVKTLRDTIEKGGSVLDFVSRFAANNAGAFLEGASEKFLRELKATDKGLLADSIKKLLVGSIWETATEQTTDMFQDFTEGTNSSIFFSYARKGWVEGQPWYKFGLSEEAFKTLAIEMVVGGVYGGGINSIKNIGQAAKDYAIDSRTFSLVKDYVEYNYAKLAPPIIKAISENKVLKNFAKDRAVANQFSTLLDLGHKALAEQKIDIAELSGRTTDEEYIDLVLREGKQALQKQGGATPSTLMGLSVEQADTTIKNFVANSNFLLKQKGQEGSTKDLVQRIGVLKPSDVDLEIYGSSISSISDYVAKKSSGIRKKYEYATHKKDRFAKNKQELKKYRDVNTPMQEFDAILYDLKQSENKIVSKQASDLLAARGYKFEDAVKPTENAPTVAPTAVTPIEPVKSKVEKKEGLKTKVLRNKTLKKEDPENLPINKIEIKGSNDPLEKHGEVKVSKSSQNTLFDDTGKDTGLGITKAFNGMAKDVGLSIMRADLKDIGVFTQNNFDQATDEQKEKIRKYAETLKGEGDYEVVETDKTFIIRKAGSKSNEVPAPSTTEQVAEVPVEPIAKIKPEGLKPGMEVIHRDREIGTRGVIGQDGDKLFIKDNETGIRTYLTEKELLDNYTEYFRSDFLKALDNVTKGKTVNKTFSVTKDYTFSDLIREYGVLRGNALIFSKWLNNLVDVKVKFVDDILELTKLSKELNNGDTFVAVAQGNTIYINKSIPFTRNQLSIILVHEGMHILTSDLLESDKEFFNAITQIRERFRNYLETTLKSGTINRDQKDHLDSNFEFISGIYSGTLNYGKKGTDLIELMNVMDEDNMTFIQKVIHLIKVAFGKAQKSQSFQTNLDDILTKYLTDKIKYVGNNKNFLSFHSLDNEYEDGFYTFQADQTGRGDVRRFTVYVKDGMAEGKVPFNEFLNYFYATEEPEYQGTTIKANKGGATLNSLRNRAVKGEKSLSDGSFDSTEDSSTKISEDKRDYTFDKYLETTQVLSPASVRSMALVLSKVLNREIVGNDYYRFINSLSNPEIMRIYDIVTQPTTDAEHLKLQELFRTEFQQKGLEKSYTFDDFVFNKLHHSYLLAISKSPKKVINVTYGTQRVQVDDSEYNEQVIDIEELGDTFYGHDGALETSNAFSTMIEAYQEAISEILGVQVEPVYINGFRNLQSNKIVPFHRAKMYKGSELKRMEIEELTEALFSQGYIFLNVFAEKKTLPAFKVSDVSKIKLEKIKQLEAFYLNMWNSRVKKEQQVQSVGDNIPLLLQTVIRAFIEDMKINSFVNKGTAAQPNLVQKNVDEILAGNTDFVYEDKDGTAVLRNFADLMKRAYLIKDIWKAPKDLNQFPKLLERFQKVIPEDDLETGNEPIFLYKTVTVDQQGNKKEEVRVYVRVAFYDAKTFAPNGKSMTMMGKEFTDGASIGIRGKFDKYYNMLYGALGTGSLKNWYAGQVMQFANNIPLLGNLFVKHAVHMISKDDEIGISMRDKGIGLLIGTSTEKNKMLPAKNTISYQELVSGTSISNRRYVIPLDEFQYDKETGKVTDEVRGLMQFMFTKGLSFNNPMINPAILLRNVLTIASNIGKKANVDIKTMTDTAVLVKHLRELAHNTAFQQEIVVYQILENFLTSGDSDTEIYQNIKGMLHNAYLSNTLNDRLHRVIVDALKAASKGSAPVLNPNLGRKSEIRSVINGIKSALFNPSANDADKLAVMKAIYGGDEETVQLQRKLAKIRTKIDEYKEIIKAGNQMGSFKSDEELQRIRFELKSSNYLKTLIAKETDLIVKELYQNELKKRGLKRSLVDEEELVVSQLAGKPKADFTKQEYKDYVKKQLNELLENIVYEKDKEGNDTDKITYGTLKGQVALLGNSIMKAQGLRIGDRITITVVPSTNLSQTVSLTVIGNLDDSSEGSIGTGGIIISPEVMTRLGRDLDIDVVAEAVRDVAIHTFDWDEYLDSIDQMNLEYAEQMYEVMKDELKLSGVITSAMKGQERLTAMLKFLDDHSAEFCIKFLGKSNNPTVFAPIGAEASNLGNLYEKPIGFITTLQTIFTIVNATGLRGQFDKWSLNPKGGENYNEKRSFIIEAILYTAMTNHRLDFPNDTRMLAYQNDETILYARAVGIRSANDMPDTQETKILKKFMNFLFGRAIQLPRVAKINFEEKKRDLGETIEYIDVQKKINKALQTLSDTSQGTVNLQGRQEALEYLLSLYKEEEITKVNKKIADQEEIELNNDEQDESEVSEDLENEVLDLKDFLISLSFENIDNYPLFKVINAIDLDLLRDSQFGIDMHSNMKIETAISKALMPLLTAKPARGFTSKPMVKRKTLTLAELKERNRPTTTFTSANEKQNKERNAAIEEEAKQQVQSIINALENKYQEKGLGSKGDYRNPVTLLYEIIGLLKKLDDTPALYRIEDLGNGEERAIYTVYQNYDMRMEEIKRIAIGRENPNVSKKEVEVTGEKTFPTLFSYFITKDSFVFKQHYQKNNFLKDKQGVTVEVDKLEAFDFPSMIDLFYKKHTITLSRTPSSNLEVSMDKGEFVPVSKLSKGSYVAEDGTDLFDLFTSPDGLWNDRTHAEGDRPMYGVAKETIGRGNNARTIYTTSEITDDDVLQGMTFNGDYNRSLVSLFLDFKNRNNMNDTKALQLAKGLIKDSLATGRIDNAMLKDIFIAMMGTINFNPLMHTRVHKHKTKGSKNYPTNSFLFQLMNEFDKELSNDFWRRFNDEQKKNPSMGRKNFFAIHNDEEVRTERFAVMNENASVSEEVRGFKKLLNNNVAEAYDFLRKYITDVNFLLYAHMLDEDAIIEDIEDFERKQDSLLNPPDGQEGMALINTDIMLTNAGINPNDVVGLNTKARKLLVLFDTVAKMKEAIKEVEKKDKISLLGKIMSVVDIIPHKYGLRHITSGTNVDRYEFELMSLGDKAVLKKIEAKDVIQFMSNFFHKNEVYNSVGQLAVEKYIHAMIQRQMHIAENVLGKLVGRITEDIQSLIKETSGYNFIKLITEDEEIKQVIKIDKDGLLGVDVVEQIVSDLYRKELVEGGDLSEFDVDVNTDGITVYEFTDNIANQKKKMLAGEMKDTLISHYRDKGFDNDKAKLYAAAAMIGLQYKAFYTLHIPNVLNNVLEYFDSLLMSKAIKGDYTEEDEWLKPGLAANIWAIKAKYQSLLDNVNEEQIDNEGNKTNFFPKYVYNTPQNFEIPYRIYRREQEFSDWLHQSDIESIADLTPEQRNEYERQFDAVVTDIEDKITAEIEFIQSRNNGYLIMEGQYGSIPFEIDEEAMLKTSPTNRMFLENLLTSLTKDLSRANAQVYNGESEIINEASSVTALGNRWYYNHTEDKEIISEYKLKDEIKKGNLIFFRRIETVHNDYYDADYERVVTYWGKVISIANGNYRIETKGTTIETDLSDAFSYNEDGEQDHNYVQVYKPYGTLEKYDYWLASTKLASNSDDSPSVRRMKWSMRFMLNAVIKHPVYFSQMATYSFFTLLAGFYPAVKNMAGGGLAVVSGSPVKNWNAVARGMNVKHLSETSDEAKYVRKGLEQLGLSTNGVSTLANLVSQGDISLDTGVLSMQSKLIENLKSLLSMVWDKEGYTKIRKQVSDLELLKSSLNRFDINYMSKYNAIENQILDLEEKWTTIKANKMNKLNRGGEPLTRSQQKKLDKYMSNGNLNELFDIDSDLALKMFKTYLNKFITTWMFKVFQFPEPFLRRSSFYVGFYEGEDLGLSYEDRIKAGISRASNTQVDYSNAERLLYGTTQLSKAMTKFTHYNIRYLFAWYLKLRQLKEYVKLYGAGSLLDVFNRGSYKVSTEEQPYKDLITGQVETLETTTTSEINIPKQIALSWVQTILINKLLAGMIWFPLKNLADPAIDMVLSMGELIGLILSGDFDPEDKDDFITLSRSLPFMGFGMSQLLGTVVGRSYLNGLDDPLFLKNLDKATDGNKETLPLLFLGK